MTVGDYRAILSYMKKTLLLLATLTLATGLLGERPSGRWIVKGETTTTTRS